ncbi:NAD(P)-binding domain protein [Moelleriella libera RCEF 2490]|uniref:NAD(P)-binding domain protein n=1 Tax=Moelleriella libera RCEF 2490 TaxID=1081109 RepID=A0A168AU31_9HYPO|nr:NAD(P)-binding domain protein [Moelleriella libera RCEF 2490]
MTKIFITGASGYIGGQVLRELSRSGIKYETRALVRNATKAATIEAAFPGVRIVIGDLDDSELLRKEAAHASIVLHLAATGHLNSVKAIHQGLSSRGDSLPGKEGVLALLVLQRVEADQETIAYWIQVSGASALAAAEVASPSFVPGSPSSLIFNDDDGVAEIRAHIRKHPKRAVDNYILDVASDESAIKTALVFPPIIYGKGEGPVNQRSIQIPSLARTTIQLGHGVTVGKGESRWGNIHIGDVGRIFAALAENAAKGLPGDETWGRSGIYLAGVGELTFFDISAKVAAAAKQGGHIPTDKVEELPKDQCDTHLPHGGIMFGTNARGQAKRARRLLNWAPREVSLEEDIPRTVSTEHGEAAFANQTRVIFC